MKNSRVVEDSLIALQRIAAARRTAFEGTVIGITGSNGKTTTKEMTYAVLSRRFKVLRNVGNLNNHIGLPLSRTRLAPEDEVIVLELGMNGLGEIERLCDIAVPSHGIITNIGSAHIGKLGSREAIRDAKLEILHGLSTAVLNGDDEFLMEGAKEFAGEKVAEINKLDGTKLIMEDGKSWLLMRESGTEPVVRLYGEAESDQKLNSLMDAGKEFILA